MISNHGNKCTSQCLSHQTHLMHVRPYSLSLLSVYIFTINAQQITLKDALCGRVSP